MSFADLILRRPLWEQLAQQLQLPLQEGAQAPALYDSVAELMFGEGARFPEDAQKRAEDTAERMKSLIHGAGSKSQVLGAFVSVLLPSSFAIGGEWQGLKMAVVPDHLAPSVSKDSRLLFAVFHSLSLNLGLEIVPEGALFQAARTVTKAQDIQTGVPVLDQRAVIRGHDEAQIKQLLGRPDVKAPLLELLEREGRWLVNDRGALITVSSSVVVAKEGSALLDLLARVVSCLRSG